MTSVVIIRSRHPLEGRSLPVLGRMRRHGQLELLLVLPDGSKRLIPQAWTNANEATVHDVVATLGSLADLLVACALVLQRQFVTSSAVVAGAGSGLACSSPV